jgi:hypothetical protein
MLTMAQGTPVYFYNWWHYLPYICLILICTKVIIFERSETVWT